MKKWLRLSLLIAQPSILSAVFVGCGAHHHAGWETKSSALLPVSQEDIQEMLGRADALWKDRVDPEKLQRSLEIYETAISRTPDNLEALSRLSRGYYFLADGHTQDPQEKLRLWEKGASYGERGMAVHADFKSKIDAGVAVEEAVKILGKEHIEPLYWSAVNLGKWAKLKGFTTILKYKKRVKEMMEHALSVDETFFYGAPHRYFGAFYAVAPSFAGGDLDKSKRHFEESLRIAPNYLATRVLFAEEYAVRAKNKKLFEEQLKYVLEAPEDVLPEIRPEQSIEKKKADKLLKEAGKYFD